ncbi:hypothetical protein EYZ11_004345 [Aspergillus tanneri]|uniref:Uncharacterized protein n=1 Tax=Aspergillus tanneri TaxID=1220188 RepID=A0A4S3JL32_9EURO|nr:hypothetical protein EYZ11_004345 [Aspergillus tanneri]
MDNVNPLKIHLPATLLTVPGLKPVTKTNPSDF